MRILLLNDCGTLAGGAEYQTLALRNGLRARGHDARWFSSTVSSGAGEVLADYRCYGTNSRLQPLLMAANPSAFARLRSTLAEFSPDVVHASMMGWQISPLVLPLLRRFPFVHHVQMYNAICPLGTRMLPDGAICREQSGMACLRNSCFSPHAWSAVMVQRALWRRWSGAVNLTVAASETLKRRLTEGGVRVDDVVWNGVPVRPQASLSEYPTVAFAGRLVHEKGVDLLLRAFARVHSDVPSAVLQIAGDGPQRADLEQLAKELGIPDSVSWLGFLPREELERRIGTAWVQVVPGRWEEPFGLVTAEAMMRGTAVVATALGGATEMVRDGITGFLVPPDDPDALAEALRTILLDRSLAGAMGRAGREYAIPRFSEDAMVTRWLAIYRDLLS